jgi:hypothetical protein
MAPPFLSQPRRRSGRRFSAGTPQYRPLRRSTSVWPPPFWMDTDERKVGEAMAGAALDDGRGGARRWPGRRLQVKKEDAREKEGKEGGAPRSGRRRWRGAPGDGDGAGLRVTATATATAREFAASVCVCVRRWRGRKRPKGLWYRLLLQTGTKGHL